MSVLAAAGGVTGWACWCPVRFVWALANKSSPGRPPQSVVYERLQTQMVELRERVGGLPSPVEAQDIWRGIWLEEAHH